MLHARYLPEPCLGQEQAHIEIEVWWSYRRTLLVHAHYFWVVRLLRINEGHHITFAKSLITSHSAACGTFSIQLTDTSGAFTSLDAFLTKLSICPLKGVVKLYVQFKYNLTYNLTPEYGNYHTLS